MAIRLYSPSTTVASSYLYCYPGNGLLNARTAQTMSVWINCPTIGTNVLSMFGFYNGTANLSTIPTTAIQIGSRSGSSIDVWTWGGGILISAVGVTFTANTWIHITYTCNTFGTNQTHLLYINGVLNNTTTNTTQINGVLTQYYINGYPEATRRAETGDWQLDDARCFNRQLTAEEILTLYNVRGSSDGLVYGSIGRYDFNEGYIGSTLAGGVDGAVAAYDLSGNNNALILSHTSISTAPTYISDYADRYDRPCHS